MSDEGHGAQSPWNTGGVRILEQLPDDLFAQTGILGLVAAVHGSEDISIRDPGAGSPRVLGILTHVGIGIARTRPCLPSRSTVHHRPSALLDVAHSRFPAAHDNLC
jgi:hypothetical protein